jgi:hypothetical protein
MVIKNFKMSLQVRENYLKHFRGGDFSISPLK